MMLYVLTLDHKHGRNTWVFSTEENRTNRLMCWARDNWQTEGLPGNPDDLDDKEVVEKYFEHMEGEESFDTDETNLDAV